MSTAQRKRFAVKPGIVTKPPKKGAKFPGAYRINIGVRTFIPGQGVTSVYKAKDGYRWRAKHKNGNIVAESGEAYTRKDECARLAEKYAPVGFNLKGVKAK